MIIVDFQQIAIANLVMHATHGGGAGAVSEDLLRHMILNGLRGINKRNKHEYGEMVIACDHRRSWRYDVFPLYKANRKKGRDSSPFDWEMVFKVFTQMRDDLRDHFPYRVIHLEGCEADDIIGTLCHEHGNEDMAFGEKILIVSGDKDFIQLHRYANVDQFDPSRKKVVKNADPKGYLFEHIIRGDGGDGIPNILSDDDTFVNENKRQKAITAKKMAMIKDVFTSGKRREHPDLDRNYCRNETLIDLTYTPCRLRDQILDIYADQAGKGRDKLFPYFIKNQLKHLMDVISEF